MPKSMPDPRTPIRYWRQGKAAQNFGDFLTELFLNEVFTLPRVPADAYHLVGSVITPAQLRSDLRAVGADRRQGIGAFWGCGGRSAESLPPPERQGQFRFFGVRGPLTRDALGLPADTVLGDPGLILPLIRPAPAPGDRPGGTLCIGHFLDPRPDAELARDAGCDRYLRARIPPRLEALDGVIRMIAGADFVLTGALHGAIIACAYGVPFAYFDSGYVDVPFKWDDFSASIGVPAQFVKTLAEGRDVYDAVLRDRIRRPRLTPILDVAPFLVRPTIMLRALAHDGVLPADTAAAAECALAGTAAADSGCVTEMQRAWLADRASHAAAARIAAKAVELAALVETLSRDGDTAPVPAV